MRRLPPLLAALLVLPLLGSDSPKGYDSGRTEIDELEGVWRAVDTSFPPCLDQELTLRRGKYRITLDGRAYTGTYKTDRTRSPRHYDERSDEPDAVTWEMIYEADGQHFRMAYPRHGPGTGPRPQSFSDGGVIVITWKRVK
jgi:uncharacterized protein (TIGR03067 family)